MSRLVGRMVSTKYRVQGQGQSMDSSPGVAGPLLLPLLLAVLTTALLVLLLCKRREKDSLCTVRRCSSSAACTNIIHSIALVHIQSQNVKLVHIILAQGTVYESKCSASSDQREVTHLCNSFLAPKAL